MEVYCSLDEKAMADIGVLMRGAGQIEPTPGISEITGIEKCRQTNF